MEEKIIVQSGAVELEGLYAERSSGNGVVITHPHPLYGGDLYSPVVEAIATAYKKLGFSTLRFNFRGVGKSSGSYDKGNGEQEDVFSAVGFLERQGLEAVHLSGYSFGAWVNALAVKKALNLAGMTMVAPPVAFIQFQEDICLPMLSSIVAGSRDEFGPPDLIAREMANWNPAVRLTVIDGADHFFWGYLEEITRRLVGGVQSG
jgi:alpha/beta superfamily hydrolase